MAAVAVVSRLYSYPAILELQKLMRLALRLPEARRLVQEQRGAIAHSAARLLLFTRRMAVVVGLLEAPPRRVAEAALGWLVLVEPERRVPDRLELTEV